MTSALFLISIIITVIIAKKILKGGFSFSSGMGTSVSSSGDDVKINGKVLSVIIDGKTVMGEPTLKASNSNTITQKNGNTSVKIQGGHVVISNLTGSLKINGKTVA